jgi:hypothetical protein
MSGNDEVDFTLRLVNEMSRPADEATKSVKGTKGAVSELEKAQEKAKETSKAHSEAMGRVGEASSKAGAGLLSFAMTAGAAVAATAVAMVVAAEKWAIEASEFQTKALMAFEAIDGTAANSRETLDSLRGMANKTGLGTDKIAEYYKELRLAGVAIEDVQDIMSAGLDVSAVLGDQAGKGLVEAIKGIREKGKFGTESLGQLKGAGIGDMDAMVKVLAGMQGSNTFGKTKAQIDQMLKAGQVDAATGTAAILKLVKEKVDGGGALGSAAEQAGNTVGGQLAALKNQLNSVFADSAVTGPFTEALKTINHLLDPTTESGKKIRATLGRAFTEIGELLSKISPEQIEKVLTATIGLAEEVMDLVGIFSGAFKSAIEPALKPLLKMFDGSESGTQSLKALGAVLGFVTEGLGRMAGAVAGTFASGITFILGIPGKLVGLYNGFKDLFDRIPNSWDALQTWWEEIDLSEVGGQIVDGLWDGIKAGWKGLLEKVEGLLDLLPTAAKKVLGIASPSKVFAEIGMYTAQGFTKGVDSEGDSVEESVEDLMKPPAVPTVSFGGPTSGSGSMAGGRGGMTIENLQVNLTVSGSDVSESNARNFAREFAREFQRTIEGYSDETGSLDADTAVAA